MRVETQVNVYIFHIRPPFVGEIVKYQPRVWKSNLIYLNKIEIKDNIYVL